MSPRLAFAIDLAFRAGRSTLPYFQTGTRVEIKADETPVTVADREAERLIRESIQERYPSDGILGEEEGAHGSTSTRWIVDPIDGTKSFVCGVPLYGTLIAFQRDGVVELGVCYFPALDEMLYAEAGQGAFFNGRACRVSSRPSLQGGVLASGSMRSMDRAGRLGGFLGLEKRAMASRTWTDAYGHALVATGRIEAMIDPVVQLYDIAALSVIVKEAGGAFTNFQGTEELRNEAISSNGLLHQEILEAFRG